MSSHVYISRLWWSERKRILVFLLLLSGSTFSQGSEVMSGTDNVVSHGVIFSQASAEKIAKRYPFLKLPPPYWMPKASDIEKIEQGLSAYLSNYGGALGKEVSAGLDSYKRQYLGYTDEGEPWVIVNGICKNYWSRDGLWHSEFIVVFDGGACFFQVRYNIKTKQFHKLELGGES